MKHTVIGLVENVKICRRTYKARIDTGAKRCSIDKTIARKLGLGPIIKTAKVKSVHGESERPVVKTTVTIKNRTFNATFNLADRKEMSYPVLIGRNVLKHGFLIDTMKQ